MRKPGQASLTFSKGQGGKVSVKSRNYSDKQSTAKKILNGRKKEQVNKYDDSNYEDRSTEDNSEDIVQARDSSNDEFSKVKRLKKGMRSRKK